MQPVRLNSVVVALNTTLLEILTPGNGFATVLLTFADVGVTN